jgi:glucosyl-3-phosphoglycerate synthase
VTGDSGAWFARSASRHGDWPVQRLLAAKGGRRVSVVVPARNEAATIADVVTRIRTDLIDAVALVDELVVIDSDSTDETAAIAADCGAKVYAAADIALDLGRRSGKGEALWKSLFVTSGDVLAFIDADLTEWNPGFVSGLLGPLFADERVLLVKGFYDRLLDDQPGRAASLQGGRVTELVARPLLNLFWPELSAVVQPLAGEWAVRRGTIERLSIPVGYGIEFAVLLDVYAAHGLDAIAQVDLGERGHRHQSVHDLGVMAAEIMHVAAVRQGTRPRDDGDSLLWQYDRRAATPWQSRQVPLAERPPAIDCADYPAGGT